MWETIQNVLNGTNGIFAYLFIGIILVVLVYALKTGKLVIRTKYMELGKEENALRSTLLREFDFINDYMTGKAGQLYAQLNSMGMEVNKNNVELIFEKILDKWIIWCVINNIRDEDDYIESKTSECVACMEHAISRINPGLYTNDKFNEQMRLISKQYTKDIIRGILTLRKEYK